MKKVNISKEKLKELYEDKILSTYSISKIYDCNPKTIYQKLKICGIKTRQKKKFSVSKEDLHCMYHDKKWPLSRIAKKFSCCTNVIFKRMKKYGILSRTMSEAKTIHPKNDFSGDLIEKAYMIGFRLGDLNVFKDYFLLYVQTSTTKSEQVNLIWDLFHKYGNVFIKKYGQVFKIQTALNKSFSFLLPKNDCIENWILENNKYFFAFLAGYIDAEGNIQLYKNRFRVRIRTYDKNILFQTHCKLREVGIHSIYGLASPAGRYNQNGDCWGLSINKQEHTLKLKKHIFKYMKHQKRKADFCKRT